MSRTDDMTKTTDEVINRFNRAFQERDATLLEDVVAPTASWRASSQLLTAPATRAMTRRSPRGRRSSDERASHFEVEDVRTGDEWALVRWRSIWGPGPADSVRGVNVTRVVEGKIVEGALLEDGADCRRPGELIDR